MKSKRMIFVVALVFLFSFAGCGAGGNALEQQIDELSAKVTEMENENKELKDKIAGLENENRELNERAEGLESDLDVLIAGELIRGAFYSVEEAYDSGYISQEEVRSIAHYLHSSYTVYIEYPELFPDKDYNPIVKSPAQLSKLTDKSIREAFVQFLKAGGSTTERTWTDAKIQVYLGTYNGCVAMMIDAGFMYSDMYYEFSIAGVQFNYPSSQRVKIF